MGPKRPGWFGSEIGLRLGPENPLFGQGFEISTVSGENGNALVRAICVVGRAPVTNRSLSRFGPISRLESGNLAGAADDGPQAAEEDLLSTEQLRLVLMSLTIGGIIGRANGMESAEIIDLISFCGMRRPIIVARKSR